MARKNKQDYSTISIYKYTLEELKITKEWLENEHQTTYSMSEFVEYLHDYFLNTHKD